MTTVNINSNSDAPIDSQNLSETTVDEAVTSAALDVAVDAKITAQTAEKKTEENSEEIQSVAETASTVDALTNQRIDGVMAWQNQHQETILALAQNQQAQQQSMESLMEMNRQILSTLSTLSTLHQSNPQNVDAGDPPVPAENVAAQETTTAGVVPDPQQVQAVEKTIKKRLTWIR